MQNKRLAELLGIDIKPYEIIEWLVGYDNYGYPQYSLLDPEDGTVPTKRYMPRTIPDFAADPRLVLREMIKREDWDLFLPEIGHCQRWKEKDTIYTYDLIRIDYMTDTTGLLRDRAIEFMERGK